MSCRKALTPRPSRFPLGGVLIFPPRTAYFASANSTDPRCCPESLLFLYLVVVLPQLHLTRSVVSPSFSPSFLSRVPHLSDPTDKQDALLLHPSCHLLSRRCPLHRACHSPQCSPSPRYFPTGSTADGDSRSEDGSVGLYLLLEPDYPAVGRGGTESFAGDGEYCYYAHGAAV